MMPFCACYTFVHLSLCTAHLSISLKGGGGIHSIWPPPTGGVRKPSCTGDYFVRGRGGEEKTLIIKMQLHSVSAVPCGTMFQKLRLHWGWMPWANCIKTTVRVGSLGWLWALTRFNLSARARAVLSRDGCCLVCFSIGGKSKRGQRTLMWKPCVCRPCSTLQGGCMYSGSGE